MFFLCMRKHFPKKRLTRQFTLIINSCTSTDLNPESKQHFLQLFVRTFFSSRDFFPSYLPQKFCHSLRCALLGQNLCFHLLIDLFAEVPPLSCCPLRSHSNRPAHLKDQRLTYNAHFPGAQTRIPLNEKLITPQT
jgi:hypothetical protein